MPYWSIYQSPSYFAPAYWGNGGVQAGSVLSLIWDDVKLRLDAITFGGVPFFDAVYVVDLAAEFEGRAEEVRIAVVKTPGDADEIDDAMDDGDASSLVTVRWTLSLMMRTNEVEHRREMMEVAVDLAKDALNGKSYAGITFPALTRLRRARAVKGGFPTATTEIECSFVYEVEGDDKHIL